MDTDSKDKHWEEPKDKKNKLLFKIGRGEDLMLSHLANRIAEKYVGEKVKVTDTVEYRSLFELAD